MASFILTQDVRERRENLHPKISLPITTECARSVIRRLRQQAKKVSQIRQFKKWPILLKSMILSSFYFFSCPICDKFQPFSAPPGSAAMQRVIRGPIKRRAMDARTRPPPSSTWRALKRETVTGPSQVSSGGKVSAVVVAVTILLIRCREMERKGAKNPDQNQIPNILRETKRSAAAHFSIPFPILFVWWRRE